MDLQTPTPARHTAAGGVVIGSDNARRKLIVYEDPQCPYCRLFEDACGDLLRREIASGSVSVEYRMRCFLGPESIRACAALALAAEADKFDQLRQAMFAAQPAEGSGGYTTEDLLALGASVGLTDDGFVSGVREGRYEDWAAELDEALQEEDRAGTPYAILDGTPVETQLLTDREGLGALIRG